MNSPLSENELKSILKIMEQMVVEAENSDWAALRLLDKKRRLIILDEDSGKSARSDTPAIDHRLSAVEGTSENKPGQGSHEQSDIISCQRSRQSVIEKIVEIDRCLNDILAEARKSLLIQSRKHNDQIKAKKCYDMASDLA